MTYVIEACYTRHVLGGETQLSVVASHYSGSGKSETGAFDSLLFQTKKNPAKAGIMNIGSNLLNVIITPEKLRKPVARYQ